MVDRLLVLKEHDLSLPRWKGRPLQGEYDEAVGFVYLIKHTKSGRYYIGKKVFWNKVTRPPLKGYKRKRRSVKESTWKTYWGSSNKLNAFIEKNGTQGFTRQILKVCYSKFDMSYTELEWQMKMKVLFDPRSWNEIVNVRLHRSCEGKEEVEDEQ